LCFYNMLYYKYAEYKPIQRVIYEVVKYASEQNYKYVDMGVSQDTAALNPMTPSNNLIAFKETFDAKTIMRNTFSITL
ncbi:GNAT family N-acetyltransferase, partial [bacterium]|nr:GNAT family N-acetyltransferase [bacterium]